jgi:hypothetical protein
MKLLNLIKITALLLPVVKSGGHLYIGVPWEFRGQSKLIGKPSSDGEPVEMTAEGIDEHEHCHLPGEGTVIGGGKCRGLPIYTYIGVIGFDKPTDEPRQLNISMPGYDAVVR